MLFNPNHIRQIVNSKSQHLSDIPTLESLMAMLYPELLRLNALTKSLYPPTPIDRKVKLVDSTQMSQGGGQNVKYIPLYQHVKFLYKNIEMNGYLSVKRIILIFLNLMISFFFS